MIHLEVTQDVLNKAQQMSLEMGALNKSITDGDGNVAGLIGEILVASILTDCLHESTFDYDIIASTGVKIDVKTLRCSSKPKPHYDVMLPAQNTRQKTDLYVFCRVHQSLEEAWILGGMGKADFLTHAYFRDRGDYTSNFTGFKCTVPCFTMQIKHLSSLDTLNIGFTNVPTEQPKRE